MIGDQLELEIGGGGRLVLSASVVILLVGVAGCRGRAVPVGDDGGRDGMGDAQGRCGDGLCASDETAQDCAEDCQACNGLPEQGCCDGAHLYRCQDGTLRFSDCGEQGCGWDGAGYVCGGQGEDPDGTWPKDCGCGASKVSATPLVYHGAIGPEAVCLTGGQILAIGALADRKGGAYENFCTATLVADKVVLTAAHCVLDEWGNQTVDPSTLFFIVGSDVSAPRHVFAVQSVYDHKGYDWEAIHDEGIVILKESATEVLPEIQPLSVNDEDLDQGFVGKVVQNVGFGSTETDENNTRRFWTTEPVTELDAGEYIVYGSHWSSVCYGDSGGPSLYGFADGSVRVVGTVSWGDTSCMDYDHFCRVDANQSFWKDYLAGWDPCFGLDEKGTCTGQVAQWCSNGRLVQRCCDGACGFDRLGRARCLSQDCPGLDEKGECDGGRLLWCDHGVVRRTWCSACGFGTCGWVDDQVGNACQ
ncbi:MAG: trypsin-like serine protease [Deltaproteobacteria bacterium]|nr:trypsin-like serine protease [Deltaproteobacteria bacterium]